MAMSKRERHIAIALGIVIGGALVNYLIVDTWLQQRSDLNDSIAKESAGLIADKDLIKKQPLNMATWGRQVELLKRDQYEAESQVLNALQQCATQAGMQEMAQARSSPPQPINKVGGKPGEREKDFQKMVLRIGVSGNMKQVGHFIYYIQKAAVPMRITDITMSSAKENTDDLLVTMGITTIFLTADSKVPGAAPAVAGGSTRPAATQGQTTRPADAGRGTATRPAEAGRGSTSRPATSISQGITTRPAAASAPTTISIRATAEGPATRTAAGGPTTQPQPEVRQ